MILRKQSLYLSQQGCHKGNEGDIEQAKSAILPFSGPGTDCDVRFALNPSERKGKGQGQG